MSDQTDVPQWAWERADQLGWQSKPGLVDWRAAQLKRNRDALAAYTAHMIR